MNNLTSGVHHIWCSIRAEFKKLSAPLRPPSTAKNGSEGYVQDYITLCNKCPLDWFAELAKECKQSFSVVDEHEVSFIPSYDQVVSPSRASSRIGIYFSSLQLIFRWLRLHDGRDYISMLKKFSSDKHNSYFRVLGSGRILKVDRCNYQGNFGLDIMVPGRMSLKTT